MAVMTKSNRQRLRIKLYLGPLLLVLYVLIFCATFILQTTTAQSYPTFTVPETDLSVLQNQFLDPTNDMIYIGALNNIYKLSENLTLLASVSTGPVNDSVECRPSPFDCDSEKSRTDNYNKVILLHDDRLITCGSIYQGTCSTRDPENLRVIYGNSRRTVVPNSPDGVAVAFIADGDGDQVLYVASSYGDWLSAGCSTVSTRQVSQSITDNNLFKTTSANSRIIIPPGTIDNSPPDQPFNISYVYGFTSGQFSYFVASQPSDPRVISRYTSKIVRLCHGDPDFNSYIELPLVCATSDDNEYNLIQSAHLATLSLGGAASEEVLVATFSKSDTGSSTPSTESAVYIFPVEDIDQEFWNRRLACAQAETGNTEIGWHGSTACSKNDLLIQQIQGSSPDEYCHTIDVQNILGGDNRAFIISSSPVYEGAINITAVSAVQHFDSVIIFIGDSSGEFKKLRLDDGTSAVEYQSVNLHRSPVIKNGLLLSPDQQFIYVTSEDQITKVPVEECQEHTTCEACHSAMDPYCGWCSLEAKCTRRIDAECMASQNGKSLRWLSTEEDCLTITSVSPEFAPAEMVTELTLNVSSLPPIPSEGSLRCRFVEGQLELGVMAADASGVSQITCNTPGNIQGTVKGFRTAELQIFYDEGGERYNIATTQFDFYDCSKFRTCSSCTRNQYGCQWGLNENECRDGSDGTGGIRDRNQCPVIYSGPKIFIPAGGQQFLSLTGNNIPSDSSQFRCEITFPDSVPGKIAIGAVTNSTSIKCGRASFNYSDLEDFVSGSLQVYWGNFPLDMEHEQIVTIYKCERKALTILNGEEDRQSCGMCLTVEDRYQCGWCPDLSSCLSPVTKAMCPGENYLVKGMECPNPKIISISPISGHIAGGTRITITGYNLGFNSADVTDISVAGTQCISVEFISPQLLSCLTRGGTEGRRGTVTVEFNDTSALSTQEFTYVRPAISLSYPMVGPQSGGTRLVLRGRNMDAGLNRSVIVSSIPCTKSVSDYPCEIEESNIAEIICKTSAGNATDGVLSANFDRGCEFRAESFFEYRPDPVIYKFEQLTSIQSGGINLEITGDSFDIIQEASLKFKVDSQVLTSPCFNSTDGTTLNCKSPGISSTDLPLMVPVMNISLYMDGVTSYVDLGNMFPGTNKEFFEFVVDPLYYDLPSGGDILQVEYTQQRQDITIMGANLTLASTSSDVTVKVGGADCMVLELTDTTLRCKLMAQKNAGKYNVQILHGNRIFQVGQVEYLPPELPRQVLVSIFAVLLFVVTVIVVCIAYFLGRCSAKNEQTKDHKRVRHSYFSKNSQQVTLNPSVTDDDYHSIDNDVDYLSVNEEPISDNNDSQNKRTPDIASDPGRLGTSREDMTSLGRNQAPPTLPRRNNVDGHTDSQQNIDNTTHNETPPTQIKHVSDSVHMPGEVSQIQIQRSRPLKKDDQGDTESDGHDAESIELEDHVEIREEKELVHYSDRIHRGDPPDQNGISENSKDVVKEEKFIHFSNRDRAIQCAEYRSGGGNLHSSEISDEVGSVTDPGTSAIGHAINDSNEDTLESNLIDPYCNKIYFDSN